MFYLVSQDQHGYRLVDFSDKIEDLNPESSPTKNAASVPMIISHQAMRAAFLVDGFQIVAVDDAGYLISLNDI